MPTLAIALAFILVSLSICFNFGFYNGFDTPVYLLIAGFVILVIPQSKLFGKSLFNNINIKTGDIIPLVFSLSVVLLLLYHPAMWSKDKTALGRIDLIIKIVFIPIILYSFTRLKGIVSILIFGFFFLTAVILRLLILTASPAPPIDTYIILNEAPRKFIAGINPYNTLYTYVFPGVTPDYYSYWPASFLLQLPFIPVFQDPRYLFLLAEIGSAILILIIAGKNMTGQLLSLTYLYRPQSLFLIEGSWLTPLNFFFVSLITYLLIKKKKGWIVGITVGILTTIQFFHVVIIAYFWKFFKRSSGLLIAFSITIGVMVLPFVIATSPVKFLNETVLFYFRNPPPPNILIHDSLNLNTLYFQYTKHDISTLISFSLIIFSFILIFIRQDKSVSSVVGSITLFFYALFLFGRQSFVNYYYFLGSLLVLWMAAIAGEEKK